MTENNITTRRSAVHWLRTHRYAYWALALVLILALYFIPEQLVVSQYTPTQLPLDDRIPFVPEFAIFYLLWFPCMVGVGLWLLFRDGDGFRKYMWYLLLAYGLAAACYLLFPNGQDLRPTLTQPDGICERLLAALYAVDTNTNVLPSLHVVGAGGFTAAVLDTKSIRSRWFQVVMCVLAVLISLSTLFVKQHAVLDVVAGVLLSAVLYLLVYRLIGRKMKRTS